MRVGSTLCTICIHACSVVRSRLGLRADADADAETDAGCIRTGASGKEDFHRFVGVIISRLSCSVNSIPSPASQQLVK